MSKKRIFAILLSLCLVFALVACGGGTSSTPTSTGGAASGSTAGGSSTAGGGDDSGEPIKIAAMFSRTGAGADNGIFCFKACEAAAEFINNNGGIASMGGAKIEVVEGDIMSDVNQCKPVAERVLADSSIMAGVGAAASSYVIPMLPAFEKAGVPYLTACVADAITNQGYKCAIQMGQNSTYYGEANGQFLQWLNEEQGLGVSKVAIMYENSEYGQSQAEAFKTSMEKAGMDIAYYESYPPSLTDASSMIANIMQTGADVVYPVATVQDAKTICNTMQSMDFYPVIFGGGAGFLMPTFAAEMGDAVDGMSSSSMANWDIGNIVNNAELQAYVDFYMEKYSEWPVEHAVTQLNAFYLIKTALEQNPTRDPEVLNETIKGLSVVSLMPGGVTNFNENGMNVGASSLFVQWQKDPEDGLYKTRAVWPVEESTVPYQKPGEGSVGSKNQ